MRVTKQLLDTIRHDHPELTFVAGDDFSWNPKQACISYQASDAHGAERLLHEVAHAVLGHHLYAHDIELIALERDAWQIAQTTLAPQYSLAISDELIQDDLDTYRDWMHARSLCPTCGASGLQIEAAHYRCVVCDSEWTVNQATDRHLRRHKDKKHSASL